MTAITANWHCGRCAQYRRMVEHLRHRLDDAQAGRRRADWQAREETRLKWEMWTQLDNLRVELHTLGERIHGALADVERHKAERGRLADELEAAIMDRIKARNERDSYKYAHSGAMLDIVDLRAERDQARGQVAELLAMQDATVFASNCVAQDMAALRERCAELTREVARLRNMEPAGRALIPTTLTQDPREARIAELEAALRQTWDYIADSISVYERKYPNGPTRNSGMSKMIGSVLFGQGHGSGEGLHHPEWANRQGGLSRVRREGVPAEGSGEGEGKQ